MRSWRTREYRCGMLIRLPFPYQFARLRIQCINRGMRAARVASPQSSVFRLVSPSLSIHSASVL